MAVKVEIVPAKRLSPAGNRGKVYGSSNVTQLAKNPNIPSELLKEALAYAERGWSVVPGNNPTASGGCTCGKAGCSGPGKHPRLDFWKPFQEQPATIERIEAWWGTWPDANVCVLTGRVSDLLVLDVDGPDGVQSLADAGHSVESLPITLTATTGKGHHYYFRMPSGVAVKNAVGLLPKVDIRADGGLVIAPPSIHANGNHYEWCNSESVANAPTWLIDLLAEADKSSSTGRLDLDVVLGGVAEGGRNAAMTQLAGRWFGKGASPSEVLVVLRGANLANKPPLPDGDLIRIVESIGSAEAAQHPVELLGHLNWPAFFSTPFIGPQWMLEPILPLHKATAIYADRKVGKSLVMLWMALEIARDPAKAVLYVDYEMGEDDLKERFQNMGVTQDDDLSRFFYCMYPKIPKLDTAKGGEALLKKVSDVQKRFPQCEVVVVIDTFGRSLKGKENDAETARDYYEHTGTRLKEEGTTAGRLDHTGKDANMGQRGSSGKNDDIDVLWKLVRAGGATDGSFTMTNELSRMGWVPEQVSLVRGENPLRYALSLEQLMPADVDAILGKIMAAKIDPKMGRDKVRDELKRLDSEFSARNEDLGAALRRYKALSREAAR